MKGISRWMLGLAVVGVTFVALESQADAFFGRFGRGGCFGHHHHQHCAPVCAKPVACPCPEPVVCPPVCDPCCHAGRGHHRRGFGLFRGRHRCQKGWGHCGVGAPACHCGGKVHGGVVPGELVEPTPYDAEPYDEPVPAAPEEPADAEPRA